MNFSIITGVHVGPKTTVWELKPHTKAKHEILHRYLDAWLPIMSKFNRRLLVLDGFAGPGRYSKGEPGSPTIAMQRLLDHQYAPSMASCEFVFVFNEQDPDRFKSLQVAVKEITEAEGFPAHVKVIVENSAFGSMANAVCDQVEAAGAQLAPMFAFLDPFGYSDLSLATLARLLMGGKAEALIFLDINSLTRFSTAGQVDEQFEALFGSDAFKAVPSEDPDKRRLALRDLYMQRLKQACGFTYTQAFLMRGVNNKPICYLIYGTKHLGGLKAMKGAMWKVDPSGQFSFSDRDIDRPTLFIEEPDFEILREAVVKRFAGTTVSIEQIEEFVLAETPFLTTHLRKPILAPLEIDDVISVAKPDGGPRRRSTYPAGCLVTFANSSN